MRFTIPKPGSSAPELSAFTEKPSDDSANPADNARLTELEKLLGYTFTERNLLVRALTHRSAHQSGLKVDYERLEYLGDAVLDLAVAHLLLDAHPQAREGELSKMRAALVNTQSLAAIAQQLNLGKFIILSRGEIANGGAERPSILADVMESVTGAIYREAGFEIALGCIKSFFGSRISDVDPRDPKTELQEALHATGSEAPVYLLECVEGPEHAPTFVSVVQVDGQIVGRGRGPTKKASQQEAASRALAELQGEDQIDSHFLDKNTDKNNQN